MGWGDEIMVSSIARRIHAMTNMRVRVLGGEGDARQSEVWKYLPFMSETGEAGSVANYICNGPGCRHYYSGMKDNRILWRKWDIAPGEMRLTDEERAWAESETRFYGRFVAVESRYKAQGGGGINKLWPHWQKFLNERPEGIIFYEMKEAPTFRHACAILERSIGYAGHEGGLHHAAAALGKPAVVVFGGYISPEITGYAAHRNLYIPHPEYPLGCGSVTPCNHCRAAMDAITVEQVVEAVKAMVQ